MQDHPDIEEELRLAALRMLDMPDAAGRAALDELAELAATICDCPMAQVSLVGRDRQWARGRFGPALPEQPRAQSFCDVAIRGATPLLVPDAARDARFARLPLVATPPHLRFYAGMPLRTTRGLAIGTLAVMDTVPRQLSARALRQLAQLARAALTTLELKRAMRQVEELAMTDPLTELHNRSALLLLLGQALARQRRDRQPVSLLSLDMDGMARMNEEHGRLAGDAALREVASVLMLCIRQEDAAARLGDDEFGVLLVGGDGAEAGVVAERIRAAVAEAMAARGWTLTISIGAACFLTPPEDEEIALAVAQGQMLKAKCAGRNRVVSIDHRAPRRLASATPSAA